jgi:hypothetical protein
VLASEHRLSRFVYLAEKPTLQTGQASVASRPRIRSPAWSQPD